MTHEFSKRDFALVGMFALGGGTAVAIILGLQNLGVYLTVLPSFSQVFAGCCLASGVGLVAHHKQKYGILLHRKLLDHGGYGLALIAVGFAIIH